MTWNKYRQIDRQNRRPFRTPTRFYRKSSPVRLPGGGCHGGSHITFVIIKPIRCTNFSNLFLEWNFTCFGQFLCPSSGVFHCTHSNGICHTGLLTACEQDHDGTAFHHDPAVSKPVWHIPLLCVQWKTPDDGQRNRPKYVEFHSKNKFEKLVHLVGFII